MISQPRVKKGFGRGAISSCTICLTLRLQKTIRVRVNLRPNLEKTLLFFGAFLREIEEKLGANEKSQLSIFAS